MNISEFDFELPENLIAQNALPDRSASRLLVLNKLNGQIEHTHVNNLPKFLRPGDCVVLNNSKVLPARLLGQTAEGVNLECFLLHQKDSAKWLALIKPGKKVNVGSKIICRKDDYFLNITVDEKLPDGKVIITLSGEGEILKLLEHVGHMPLPPYIKRADTLDDKARYQTVYAKNLGSVAAPTAGLHFTPELIAELKSQGIEFAEITLHVGYGTFKPVRAENVAEHTVDPEVYEISVASAEKINAAKKAGRRVIAIGTTTTRTLEYVAQYNNGQILPGTGLADIVIYPGHQFLIISGLMTNFHLPKSSLLLLVSAFAGKATVLSAYRDAIKNGYRFYSYGDAMLIV